MSRMSFRKRPCNQLIEVSLTRVSRKKACDVIVNRPFPSSKKSHFQNEAKCETFVVKMSCICIIIKNHFHINGFALSLALKVRFFGTRKWPITVTIKFRKKAQGLIFFEGSF